MHLVNQLYLQNKCSFDAVVGRLGALPASIGVWISHSNFLHAFLGAQISGRRRSLAPAAAAEHHIQRRPRRMSIEWFPHRDAAASAVAAARAEAGGDRYTSSICSPSEPSHMPRALRSVPSSSSVSFMTNSAAFGPFSRIPTLVARWYRSVR